MFNLRRVFASWAFVALSLGSAGWAQAQTTAGGVTVTVPATGIRRDHQDGAGKVFVSQMNYKDCLTEDFFTFVVTLSPNYAGQGYTLEAWAGTSCDMISARPPATTATCWQINSIVPNNINMSIKAEVRKILAGRTNGSDVGTGGTGGTGGSDSTGGSDTSTSGTGGSSGSTATVRGIPVDAPPECIPTSKGVGAQGITLYFMLLDSAGMVGGQAQWKGTYKLLAPDPPTGVKAGIGENSAPISWAPTTDQPDQTIDGYQLFCDPAPGQKGLDNAGVVIDPGILPASCTDSDVLVENAIPADEYKCGTTAKTATKGTAEGLINGAAYNVSVAATDTYRNVGTVSTPPACAIPQPVTGFFEAYRAAGGQGGGGFCGFSRQHRPVVLWTVVGLGLCLVLRRRRAT